jgi:cysteine synthase
VLPQPARLEDRWSGLAGRLRALACDSGRAVGDAACATIGRTPTIRLARLGGAEPRAELLAKLESRNPGGSIKDRTALGLVLDAHSRGIGPSVPLVEATAGNTGIGLALVGRAFGHDVVLVMPERYSSEKRTLCQALGARVVSVPGATVGMPQCIARAREVAEELGGVVLDQFANPANAAIHELTTGPELWEQAGAVDALVIGVGTGGTLSGVARYLRRRLPDLEVHAVESQGSVLGGREPRATRVEGIGSLFEPPNFDRSLVTSVITVEDEDAFRAARELASCEGLLAGASSGAIAHAALQVARRLGPGRRVATLLPDGGDRYISKGLYEGCQGHGPAPLPV